MTDIRGEISKEEIKSNFVPGDKNIKEPAAPVQDSIVDVMEESQFGLATA